MSKSILVGMGFAAVVASLAVKLGVIVVGDDSTYHRQVGGDFSRFDQVWIDELATMDACAPIPDAVHVGWAAQKDAQGVWCLTYDGTVSTRGFRARPEQLEYG